MGVTVKHHIDFLNEGYIPLGTPLGGGSDKMAYKGYFYWRPAFPNGDPQYEIELCITNPNAGPGICKLGRETSYGTLDYISGFSISLTAGAVKTTFRGSFSFPIDGNENNWNGYVLEVDNNGPVVGDGIDVFSARMTVSQTNATNGIFWRPLSNGQEGQASPFWGGYALQCTGGSPCIPPGTGLWERLDSDYDADSKAYKIASTLAGTHVVALFAQHVKSGLYNETTGNEISTQVNNNPGPGFFSTPQFAFNFTDLDTSDVDFIDGDMHQWKWLETKAGDPHKIFGAYMYVILEGMRRVTTWARVSKKTGTSGGFPVTADTSRVRMSDFAGADECFTEVSGFTTTGIVGRVDLLDSGASDSAGSGTAISGASIYVSSTSADVLRSVPFSPSSVPSTSRVICYSALESGSGANFVADWVLIGARWGEGMGGTGRRDFWPLLTADLFGFS